MDVLGNIRNIPFTISISPAFQEYFINHTPSEAAVTWWLLFQLMPLSMGSQEGIRVVALSLHVRISKQQTQLWGVCVSVQKIKSLDMLIEDMLMAGSGNLILTFCQQNYKSHKISLPPTLPVKHNLPLTSSPTILSSCISVLCAGPSPNFVYPFFFPGISIVTKNRAAEYIKYSRPFKTQVKSLASAKDWLKPRTQQAWVGGTFFRRLPAEQLRLYRSWMMGSGQTMTPLDQSAQTETTWQPIPEYITFIMRAMSINYIVNLYKAQQIMGNHEPTYLPSPKTSSDTACLPLRTTFHTHDNTPALIQIFKLFLREPYHFIHSIDIQTIQQNCCSKTVLRVKSPSYPFNLQNLLTIKRKTKGFFVEKEIWYIIRNAINVFAYMQSANTVIGTMNPKIFNLDQGRYLAFDVLHMLPQNQHQKNVSLHNYYSPQKIHEIAMEPFEKDRYGRPLIDLFKSEVFAFGLLILQVATCPASKPKFHRPSLKQMVWGQIVNRYEMSQQRYSDKLNELLEMMLREDVRIRPDWSYLRIWMMRNQMFIDIAPCVFWAI